MECNSNRRAVGLVASLALLLAGAAAIAEQAPYITQQMIDAGGGYPLAVKKLGRFKVTRVYLPDHPAKECRVDRRSLAKLLRQGFADGHWEAASGVKVTVELEMHITSGSDGEREIVCAGGGKGCKAEIEVEEVVAR